MEFAFDFLVTVLISLVRVQVATCVTRRGISCIDYLGSFYFYVQNDVIAA